MKAAARAFIPAVMATLAAVPGIAAEPTDCRAIRALTNLDGKNFSDLSLGVFADPFRVSVRVGRDEALPTPEFCDLVADNDSVELNCTWRRPNYTAASSLFDSIFAQFQQCLGGRMTPPTGPESPGSATAVKASRSNVEMENGETMIDLSHRDASQTSGLPANHFIDLTVTHVTREPED